MISRRTNYYCNGNITQIENYELAIHDTTQTWDCHHRKEIDEGLSTKQLKEQGLYLNRPASELILLTREEHIRLHQKGENNNMYDKHHSEETKKKIKESNKNKTRSEETRNRISKSKKGKPQSKETRKKRSESMKGFIPFSAGKHRVYDNKELKIYHYE